MKEILRIYSVFGEKTIDKKYGYSEALTQVLEEYSEWYEKISNMKLLDIIPEVTNDWKIDTSLYEYETNMFNEALFMCKGDNCCIHLYEYIKNTVVHLVIGIDLYTGVKSGYMYIEEDKNCTIYLPEVELLQYVFDAIACIMMKNGRCEDGRSVAKWGYDFQGSTTYKRFELDELEKMNLRKLKRLMKKSHDSIVNNNKKDIEDTIEEYKQHMKNYYQNEEE